MAILESETKVIGGVSYEVTKLGSKLGNRVLLKIGKSLGPLFLVAQGGAGVDAARASEAIQGLSEDDFEWVVDKLARSTTVNLGGAESPSLAAVFDLHFAGKYEAEFEWLEFAVEVNYGPFFRGLKAKAARAIAANGAAARMPSTLTSPTTSTGVSNGS